MSKTHSYYCYADREDYVVHGAQLVYAEWLSVCNRVCAIWLRAGKSLRFCLYRGKTYYMH